VVVIKSKRAQELLTKPRAIDQSQLSKMRKYPSDILSLWANIELEGQNVKNLSFAGTFQDHVQVMLEALAALLKGRPLALLEKLSLRECEAFLRDRNSELALENLSAEDEELFKKIFQWLRYFRHSQAPQEYHFASHKTAFRNLKLVEKIKEIKAFLNSFEVQKIYQDGVPPELVDVDDLTVYIQAPYQSENDRALFEELHILGISTFQEENLNFIPEA